MEWVVVLFSFMLYELGMNVVKYGVFLVLSGCVYVGWLIEGGEMFVFMFIWKEEGGLFVIVLNWCGVGLWLILVGIGFGSDVMLLFYLIGFEC